MSRRLALLITADKYSDPGLADLRSPVHDATALARVLADREIGNFEVETVSNQPAHIVAGEIEAKLADASPDDLILLYLSCHGLKDDAGRLYFATTNTIAARRASTAVSADFVAQQLDDSRCRQVLTLLDCCYSGAFSRGLSQRAAQEIDVGDRLQGNGRIVITASTATEYAFEIDSGSWIGEPSPSIFTSAVVRGLDSGAADRDGDGLVSADELYDYVLDEVRRITPKQTPSKVSRTTGPLYVAKRGPKSSPRHGAIDRDDDVFGAARHESPDVRATAIPPLYQLGKRPDPEARRASLDWLRYLRQDQDEGVAFAADQVMYALMGVHPSTRHGGTPSGRDRRPTKGPRGLVERVVQNFVNPQQSGGDHAEFLPSVGLLEPLPDAHGASVMGPLRLASVGLKVPRNAADTAHLLAYRPPGWEYLYFGAVLHREMKKLEPRWRDHEMRYVHRSDRKAIRRGEEPGYLSDAIHQTSRLLNIEGVLSPETQERAFGAPGQSGNPDLIEHMACRLATVFSDLMAWAATTRGAIVNEKYERLYALTAQFVDLPLRQFRQFVDVSLSRLDRISMLIVLEIPIHLPLELTVTADETLMAAQKRELKRISR